MDKHPTPWTVEPCGPGGKYVNIRDAAGQYVDLGMPLALAERIVPAVNAAEAIGSGMQRLVNAPAREKSGHLRALSSLREAYRLARELPGPGGEA